MCGKRILRRFCVLIGGVVTALLIVAVITEKWRGRNRLNRVLHKIESGGVTLDLQAAFERDVPDVENGAIDLSNLTERIRGFELPVDFLRGRWWRIRRGLPARDFVWLKRAPLH